MPHTAPTREDDLRQLLTDAIEVQLAALKAGISFWTDWIEQTSAFVQSATNSLSTLSKDDHTTKDSLLELVDAGRASLRSMTEIPRHTASRFIEELDRLAQNKGAAATPKREAKSASPSKRSKKAGRARRTRAGRAKV